MPPAQISMTCCCCGKQHPNKDFLQSGSTFYISARIPICIDCLAAKYRTYANKYKDPHQAMRRVCMAFDIYYNPQLLDSCLKDDVKTANLYMRKLVTMKRYLGLTYEDTIDEDNGIKLQGSEVTGYSNVDMTAPVDSSGKWGPGFESSDYVTLDSHYKYLKDANPNSDGNLEIFILDLCYIKMQQLKAVREGRTDDFNKLTESYRKSFQQSGLKTVRDAGEIENFTIGVTAETIEKFTPAEYYKNKRLFKDFDGLGDYFRRFVVRPFKNLMTGSKDRDIEFYVKEEEDVYDEFEDDG